MSDHILIESKIKHFKKIIRVASDKSISIRSLLLASQAVGTSEISNLLESEDVLNTIKVIRKLGISCKKRGGIYYIYGFGLNGFNIKKNITINAGNSGTLARLILGLLVRSNYKIKLIGDKSLSKRDFSRVTIPLTKFGAKFLSKNGKLPVVVKGTNKPKPIFYNEKNGSAQCKSSIMLAAINTKGETIIKAKKSRNHSELLFKYLGIPIKIYKKKKYDIIRIKGGHKIPSLNYRIPSDISSSAFFIVLTALSKSSKLKIKNVNINPSRTGVIDILKKMGVKISKKNLRKYKGEKIADLIIKSSKNLRSIKCPTKFNSLAIDEFLLIFLVAAKAKGTSYFKNLSELNQKESPRLKWGSRILNKIGVKNIVTNDSIKIYGNPNLEIKREIIIKDFLKDHRVFMTSVIAALTFGGNWKVYDKSCINTSFPSFLDKIKFLGAKIKYA